ncbi:MAG: methyltransferase domain-containing protein, partial [Candidatus Brocadiales bacterium]|nr:methyltransferase domain-containing protein [Candidatus Bathyanammoxibius sp.]
MKYKLLGFVCCPVCKGPLALEVFVEKDEVEEGRLTCEGCTRIFPVINGMPRLLPDELANMVLRFHAPFFDRYAGPMSSYLRRCQTQPQDGWWRAQRRTLTSFSYQWRKFKEMIPHWEQVFLDSISPIEAGFFRGKVGLDAGCGFGRSLYYAASYGAEVIGMDLSEAVEAARENTRHLPNVHLIQADIFNPPLRERSLDFVYSIGVLHHLPDPKQGFLALSHLLTHGAPIFIWVTSRGRGRQIALFTLMRSLSTRLPLRLLDFL